MNEIILHTRCGQILYLNHKIQSFEIYSAKKWWIVQNTEVAFQYYKANSLNHLLLRLISTLLKLEISTLIVWIICFCVCLSWNFKPSKAWNFNPSKAWKQLFVIVFRRVEISSFRRVEIKRQNRWLKLKSTL